MAILGKFDLDTFRSEVSNVARPYLFYIQIPKFPGATSDTRRYTFLAQGTKVPERKVGELETKWQGYTYKLGGVSTGDTGTVDFLLDDEASGYKQMRGGADKIHDPVTNVHGNPGTGSDGYVVDGIKVQQIHHADPAKVIIEFNLIGAWPATVAGYDMKYEAATSPVTFQVTFNYIYAKFTV